MDSAKDRSSWRFPREDPASENPCLKARLVRSLYGTLDAPQLWTKHVGWNFARTRVPRDQRSSRGVVESEYSS